MLICFADFNNISYSSSCFVSLRFNSCSTESTELAFEYFGEYRMHQPIQRAQLYFCIDSNPVDLNLSSVGKLHII